MTSLAHVYDAEGRADEAQTLVIEALGIFRQVQGETHPHTIMIMSDLDRLYTDHHKFTEAEPLVSKAVACARQSLPEVHRWTGICLIHQGRCLTGLKRYDEAEVALLDGHRILDVAVGPEHIRTARAITALGELYAAWCKPEKADEWRARMPEDV